MPRRERPLPKGRWRAIALSVMLHSGIVAAAVYGWFTWKHRPPPAQTMAIEAMVVDAQDLKGLPPAPKPQPPAPEPEPEPAPPEPPPEEQGPPKPDPAELERQREEERLAKEKLEQEKVEAEKKEADRQEQERLEAEKQAVAKAAAEKAEAEKAAAEKKRKADEAAAAKKAAEEKARQAREAELRKMLEAEESGNAMRNSEEAARWHAAIVGKIQRAWIRPPSAQPGITCIVAVSQVPGGEVTSVNVTSCSINDPALRESVEAAVYRASPLPAPPNPALFERNLELTFAPK